MHVTRMETSSYFLRTKTEALTTENILFHKQRVIDLTAELEFLREGQRELRHQRQVAGTDGDQHWIAIQDCFVRLPTYLAKKAIDSKVEAVSEERDQEERSRESAVSAYQTDFPHVKAQPQGPLHRLLFTSPLDGKAEHDLASATEDACPLRLGG